jgi:hypothetical protein
MTTTPTTISSPLEDIFDIENGTTEKALQLVPASTEMTSIDETEEKEISIQLNTVYNYALEAFEQQTANVQTIDPKFAARTAEVAAQYLTIALSAVNTRVSNRDRREKRKGSGKIEQQNADNIQNNIIVADRNEILRMIRGQDVGGEE